MLALVSETGAINIGFSDLLSSGKASPLVDFVSV